MPNVANLINQSITKKKKKSDIINVLSLLNATVSIKIIVPLRGNVIINF